MKSYGIRMKFSFSIFCMLLLFFQAAPLLGQTTDKEEIVFSTFLNKGSSADQSDSAMYYFNKAAESARDTTQLYRLNYQVSAHYFDANKMDSAHFWIDKNLTHSLEIVHYFRLAFVIGRSYNLKRLIFSRRSQYAEAITCSEKAIKVFESHNLTYVPLNSAYLNLGIDYWRLKEYNSATEWLTKSLELSETLKIDRIRIKSLISLGLTQWKLRNFKQAEDYYNFALVLTKNQKRVNTLSLLSLYDNLGNLALDKNDHESAFLHFNDALSVVRDFAEVDAESNYKTFRPYHEKEILSSIGTVYSDLKDYENTLKYIIKSIEISEEFFPKEAPELISKYSNLAFVYENLNDRENALEYMKKALRLSKINKQKISKSYNSLARIYAGFDEPEMALKYYDSALKSNQQIILDDRKWRKNPIYFLESLRGIVKIKTFDRTNDEEVRKALGKLYIEFKNYVLFVSSKVDDNELEENIHELFSDFFDFYYETFSQTKDEKIVAILWEISELSKSAKLRASMNNKLALSNTFPKSKRREEKKILDSLNHFLSVAQPGSFDSSVFIWEKKLKEFTSVLEKQHPKYYSLKYDFKVSELDDRLSVMNSGELVSSFFKGIKNLYQIRLINKKVKVDLIDGSLLENEIGLMNKAIVNNQIKELAEVSKRIKEILNYKEEDLKGVTKITVIPDDFLWKLNLNTLKGKGKDYAYFGSKYSIIYEYFSINNTNSKSGADEVLAFSYDSASNEKSQMNIPLSFRNISDNLPGTSKEVSAIADIWSGNYFYSNLASETNFKQNCENYGILHLAVHGNADRDNPELSYLEFPESDEEQDGKLYAYELDNLNLNSSLVVLSACGSGDGKIDSGEGIISLARSFQYAGSKSVLVNRWDVPDNTTPVIMKYFYQNLKEGYKKSEALRMAQSKFLKEDADVITSAPFFWAGFYLVGSDEVVYSGTWQALDILFVGIGLVLVMIVIYLIRRKLAY